MVARRTCVSSSMRSGFGGEVFCSPSLQFVHTARRFSRGCLFLLLGLSFLKYLSARLSLRKTLSSSIQIVNPLPLSSEKDK